jgi:hypothetical protein
VGRSASESRRIWRYGWRKQPEFRGFSGARAARDRGERWSAPCASDFEDALHRGDVLHRASAWEVASCKALRLVLGGRARRDQRVQAGEVQELDPASGNK